MNDSLFWRDLSYRLQHMHSGEGQVGVVIYSDMYLQYKQSEMRDWQDMWKWAVVDVPDSKNVVRGTSPTRDEAMRSAEIVWRSLQ